MAQGDCKCGHEKRDHRTQRAGTIHGECKVCLCDGYVKVEPPQMSGTEICQHSSLRSGAPVMDWILERIERKGCPQGLNVIAEELQWMGQDSMTYEKLRQAVSTELRKSYPRIVSVAEGVYWFADKVIPAGWSLYADKRMLPCFYREYPPVISWDELDHPDNILPRPGTH
jgi:hypothetical protein